MCIIYGWTLDYALNMPARAFFAMRLAGVDMRRKHLAESLLELCHVARFPNLNERSQEKLLAWYEERTFPKSKKPPVKSTGMDPTDPRTIEILMQQFSVAKRVMGLA
jgi:hypothetical protein